MKLTAVCTLLALCAVSGSAYGAVQLPAAAPTSTKHSTPTPSPTPHVIRSKVIIIGAGASGIAAAKALTAANVTDFVVLEGRTDVIGGRMHNIPFPKSVPGSTVEIGANWVEGIDSTTPKNPITLLADKYNLTRTPTNWESFNVRNNKGPVSEKIWGPINDKLGDMQDDCADLADSYRNGGLQDMSLRAAYRMLGWHPTTPLEQTLEWNAFDGEQAERPDVSSLEYTADMANFGEGQMLVADSRGYKFIIEQEAKAIGLGYHSPRLHLGQVVNNITWAAATGSRKATVKPSPLKEVTVTTKDGSVYVADYVITSTSLGVLQGTDLEFTPPLPPWKIQAIDVFDIATYTKIFLNFPSVFWDANGPEFTLYSDPNVRGRYIYWMNLKASPYKAYFNPKTNIFFVTIADDEARRVEALTDEQVLDEIDVVLKSMFGPSTPRATEIFVPRWHSDPLFRGTFTNWPIGEVTAEFLNLRAPIGNVWFTGEHTSEQYFGYVHGAWLAGGDTGSAVAQCIQGKCPDYPVYEKIMGSTTSPSPRSLDRRG
ncbi:hypothetical protein HKX48_006681 [Thoreauomyces humboldtii]|nr:hypothetical protein HKX48_006681 [Thoreauomyces humboldtii]